MLQSLFYFLLCWFSRVNSSQCLKNQRWIHKQATQLLWLRLILLLRSMATVQNMPLRVLLLTWNLLVINTFFGILCFCIIASTWLGYWHRVIVFISDAAPPSYDSIFGKVKQINEESSSKVDCARQVCQMFCNSGIADVFILNRWLGQPYDFNCVSNLPPLVVGCLLFLAVFLGIPVSMIVMGEHSTLFRFIHI